VEEGNPVNVPSKSSSVPVRKESRNGEGKIKKGSSMNEGEEGRKVYAYVSIDSNLRGGLKVLQCKI
jgi:hypothetical protein